MDNGSDSDAKYSYWFLKMRTRKKTKKANDDDDDVFDVFWIPDDPYHKDYLPTPAHEGYRDEIPDHLDHILMDYIWLGLME